MGQRVCCQTRAGDISQTLGICLRCIRQHPAEAVRHAMKAHRQSRAKRGLPAESPKDPKGAPCKVCLHECRIRAQGVGYCGLRKNVAGEVKEITAERGKLSWYRDSLPTNCVGDWVCAGCTGASFPKYACRNGPEFGYENLTVFFQACSFNCLFCQNWQFRQILTWVGPADCSDLSDLGRTCATG